MLGVSEKPEQEALTEDPPSIVVICASVVVLFLKSVKQSMTFRR